MRIVFATGNEGKMKEIRRILGDLSLPVLSMKEAGCFTEIEENGESFEENAVIKARAIGPLPDTIVMADDSGFEVEVLFGEPGVYSSRYLGEETPYEEKMRAILSRVHDLPFTERKCDFRAAIAVLFPDGTAVTTDGIMEGLVAYAPAGENGFGYDPIFYLPAFDKTAAELTGEEKDGISHRAAALKKAKEIIRVYLEEKETKA